MRFVFVDANAWISLVDDTEHLHKETLILNSELQDAGVFYITTNFVLDETYTFFTTQYRHDIAIKLGEYIKNDCDYLDECDQKNCRFMEEYKFRSCKLDVTKVDDKIEEKAWKILKDYRDKDFSYTDCTSFAVMDDNKIYEAFTNDNHFNQKGYRALLREEL